VAERSHLQHENVSLHSVQRPEQNRFLRGRRVKSSQPNAISMALYRV